MASSHPAKPGPLKVFILAGQSNMEGQAVADLDGKDYNGGRGTLKYLLKSPDKAALVKHLTNERGGWAVRDDVWVRYQPEKGPVKAGPLTLGFTPYGGKHHFGPELQFGHVLGDHLDNQVLLIKTAWGGKSLYKDFRPPGSGGDVGPYYRKMLAEVRTALASLKKDFPGYDGKGYELAGFVWYHGWNDGCEPRKAVPEYERNLVNLIKDVRKDLKAPNLPVVIGELTGPWVKAPGEWATLRKAQAAVAARKEFAGNVLFVETHDFVRKPEDSPNPGHGHHEFGNAETYFLVGDALGKGMKKLLGGTRAGRQTKLTKPASRTSRALKGWSVRVDDRLLAKPNELATKTAHPYPNLGMQPIHPQDFPHETSILPPDGHGGNDRVRRGPGRRGRSEAEGWRVLRIACLLPQGRQADGPRPLPWQGVHPCAEAPRHRSRGCVRREGGEGSANAVRADRSSIGGKRHLPFDPPCRGRGLPQGRRGLPDRLAW
jgi:hypothetical protein